MKDGFFRVGAVTPRVRVADVAYNREQILQGIETLYAMGCGAVCFPELALTGYTCGDLFRDRTLLRAAEQALEALMADTARMDVLCAVGVPVPVEGALYNGCAVFIRGRLLGIALKENIPNYSEFYEARLFTPGSGVGTVRFAGQAVPVGTGLLFPCENVEGLCVGAEICEDLWTACPPSTRLALGGATVLLNPSCSDETVGKAEYREELVKQTSGRLLAAYVYADSGFGESTTDMVFAGHKLICENGSVRAQNRPFAEGPVTADIDLELLLSERRRMNTWTDRRDPDLTRVPFSFLPETLARFEPARTFAAYPFVPEDRQGLSDRCEQILTMQSVGLATRLEHIGCRDVVLNLSGGLDSTLALLVAVRAFDRLGLDRRGVHTLSLPCFGTTQRTKSNAQRVAEELAVGFQEISIGEAVHVHFRDIGQPADRYDVTFENAQARERTQVAMDMANRVGGIVLGTGDLSELALGWATYNGDHMSMYGVNASIPKTLVRHLVRHEAARLGGRLGAALEDILATPVSPELLPPQDGEIAQRTEELVGPYELHDFFLYYMLRYGFQPGKIYRMACRTFADRYDAGTVKQWLTVFYRRFFAQQFKRSCLPDGPKVGSVTLSPRGDFRMPSDACARLWLDAIEKL